MKKLTRRTLLKKLFLTVAFFEPLVAACRATPPQTRTLEKIPTNIPTQTQKPTEAYISNKLYDPLIPTQEVQTPTPDASTTPLSFMPTNPAIPTETSMPSSASTNMPTATDAPTSTQTKTPTPKKREQLTDLLSSEEISGIEKICGKAKSLPSDLFGLSLPNPYYHKGNEEYARNIIDIAHYLGAKSTILEFYVEPNGMVNFKNHDFFIRTASKEGMELIGLLGPAVIGNNTLQLYTDTDVYVKDFSKAIGEIVTRYKNYIAGWEVFSEENSHYGLWAEAVKQLGYGIDQIPPEIYAKLLIAAYKTIKNVSPTIEVIMGALIPPMFLSRYDPTTEYQFNPADPRTVLDPLNYYDRFFSTQEITDFRNYYGHLPMDTLSYHPYLLETTRISKHYPLVEEMLRKHSVHLKRRWTEFGKPSSAPGQKQECYLLQGFELGQQFGTNNIIWHQLVDSFVLGHPEHSNYGLLKRLGDDGRIISKADIKPSFLAYKYLTAKAH